MYSSQNNNIKCECISFDSFHYDINIDVVLPFVVFSDFNYMFLL